MKIEIEVSPATRRSLASKAEELGVSLEDLAKAALVDIATRPGREFQAAARYVLRKNRELYRRLAR